MAVEKPIGFEQQQEQAIEQLVEIQGNEFADGLTPKVEMQQDGGAIVGDIEQNIQTGFDMNIAEVLDDDTLNNISSDLRQAHEDDKSSRKDWEPETILIEAKASGMPLTQELRQIGIPVVTYTPSKGNDKHVRVNSVAPLFEAGQVWCTEDRFAEEVVEECAAFPYGDNDDLVDSTTQALLRFRQGNFIQLESDYIDEPRYLEPRRYYY